jgi:hypothetical protein
LASPAGKAMACLSGRKYSPRPHTARNTPRNEQSASAVVAFFRLLSHDRRDARISRVLRGNSDRATYVSHCDLNVLHANTWRYQETFVKIHLSHDHTPSCKAGNAYVDVRSIGSQFLLVIRLAESP